MRHPNDDQLLEHHLDLMSAPQAREVADHLAGCPECRARLEAVNNQVDLIGSFDPELPTPVLPMPRTGRSRNLRWVRAALLLVVGFGAGFGAARLWAPEPVQVRGSRLILNDQAEPAGLFSSCESVATSVVVAELADR